MKQDIENFVTEESRGQSVPISNILLLVLIISLVGGVVAAGVNPIADTQADVAVDVITDRFQTHQQDVGRVVEENEGKRLTVASPPGTLSSGSTTTIKVNDTNNPSKQYINTTQLTYSTLGEEPKETVIMEAGLITQQRGGSSPAIVSEPIQTTHTTAAENILLLSFQSVDYTSSFSKQAVYPREVRLDTIPDNKDSALIFYTQNADVKITVESTQYEAWERVFERSDAYSSVTMDADDEKVVAEVKPKTSVKIIRRAVTVYPV